jgi:competence ComEA-like helix-hairpin-helix protein
MSNVGNVAGGAGVLGTTHMPRPGTTGHESLPWWFVGSCAALLSVLATVMVVAQEPAPSPAAAPGAQIELASGPGADLFQRVCVLCHPPDRIVSVRKTKTEWEEVLDKMITKGAQINDDNYAPIENYLLRNYGKINVNKAVKDDLVLILGVTPAEAESVLKFRSESGPFADFEALGKVPGLDVKMLEAKRDAIAF